MAGKYESKILDIVSSLTKESLTSFAKDRIKKIGRNVDDKKITCLEAAENINDECKLYLKGYEIKELAEKLERLTW